MDMAYDIVGHIEYRAKKQSTREHLGKDIFVLFLYKRGPWRCVAADRTEYALYYG